MLLILPTSSYRAADFVLAARSLGVEIAVAAEEDLPLSGFDRFVRIDCSNPEAAAEAITNLASSSPIDAIVAVDDAGVVIAALASTRLGLPYNTPQAALATRNKAVLRQMLAAAEVPQPAFKVLGAGDDAEPIGKGLGYPLVVKPLALSGSRGVIKVDAPEELEPTLRRVRSINEAAGQDPAQPLLLERFQPGPEVAVEGMLWKGDLEVLAVFDKPDPLQGPYFEETIYVTPSRHPSNVLAEVKRVSQHAATALGLVEGPIHAELRITEGRPSVIEIAGRSIGGLCGRALTFGLLATSLETLILRQALGRRHPGLKRGVLPSGVMMLPIPRAGVFRGMRGVDEAAGVTGVTAIEITAPLGTLLSMVPESDRYLGFVFAKGPSPEAVESSLRQAHSRLVPIIE